MWLLSLQLWTSKLKNSAYHLPQFASNMVLEQITFIALRLQLGLLIDPIYIASCLNTFGYLLNVNCVVYLDYD